MLLSKFKVHVFKIRGSSIFESHVQVLDATDKNQTASDFPYLHGFSPFTLQLQDICFNNIFMHTRTMRLLDNNVSTKMGYDVLGHDKSVQIFTKKKMDILHLKVITLLVVHLQVIYIIVSVVSWKGVRLDARRSSVRNPTGLNQRLQYWYLLLLR